MKEEDLELLLTLDDPGEDAQEEDTGEVIIENDPYTVTFGQGDWTCALMRFTGTTNHDALKGSAGTLMQITNKNFEIECCRVTRWKNGKIVEEKVFYELVGLRKQIGDVAKDR